MPLASDVGVGRGGLQLRLSRRAARLSRRRRFRLPSDVVACGGDSVPPWLIAVRQLRVVAAGAGGVVAAVVGGQLAGTDTNSQIMQKTFRKFYNTLENSKLCFFFN